MRKAQEFLESQSCPMRKAEMRNEVGDVHVDGGGTDCEVEAAAVVVVAAAAVVRRSGYGCVQNAKQGVGQGQHLIHFQFGPGQDQGDCGSLAVPKTALS